MNKSTLDESGYSLAKHILNFGETVEGVFLDFTF